MRQTYLTSGLLEEDLADDPMTQFDAWFCAAVHAGVGEPNAMVLATATPAGVPSARVVLLKAYDEGGFVFYTNYDSRKAAELAGNPRAALLFPWHDLERQVRVEGVVGRTSAAESELYFSSRPRGSQLGAWASPQSAVLSSRAELAERLAEVTDRFGVDEDADPVPLPDFWGGYRLRPDVVEFWQGRSDRLHDRLRYRHRPSGWRRDRLAP
jgi:pyridoxamine 5'-phosphate oxidase